MGGGGSIAAMNSTLKNNRALLTRKKARLKEVRRVFQEKIIERKKFHDKEISHEELQEIKEEIRKMVKKQELRSKLLITIFTFIAVTSISILLLMI